MRCACCRWTRRYDYHSFVVASDAETVETVQGDELTALVTRIQNAGTEVVEAKAGAGSAR